MKEERKDEEKKFFLSPQEIYINIYKHIICYMMTTTRDDDDVDDYKKFASFLNSLHQIKK